MKKTCPSAVLLSLLAVVILVSGACSRHEESGSPPPVASPGVAGGTQPSKVLQDQPPGAVRGADEQAARKTARESYEAFSESFRATFGAGDTADALRERVNLAEKARLEFLMLSVQMKEPAEKKFFLDLCERLETYRDMAERHITTLEDARRIREEGEALKERMKSMPDKEKAKAMEEYNHLVDRHNSLVTGSLAEERKGLEELASELVSLKTP